MTPNDTQAIAAIAERHAKMPKGDYTKRCENPRDDWGLVRRPDGMPFADVAMSCDYNLEDCGKPVPPFVEAKREFVANAVADIDTLLQAIADRDATIRDLRDKLIGATGELSRYHEMPLGEICQHLESEVAHYRSEVERLSANGLVVQQNLVRVCAERDEAAANGARRERERNVAWLRREAEDCGLATREAYGDIELTLRSQCRKLHAAADAIAAGEEPT
jgi:hypothetical protein